MKALHCVVLSAAILTVIADEQFRTDYEYSSHAQKWIKFHKSPTEWWLAEIQCFNEGGILASPLNDNIKEVMISIISQNPDVTQFGVHTGIHNRLNNAEYTSVEGIPLSKISPQYSGLLPEKYSFATYCMRMNAEGALSAGNCKDALPYLCYKKNTGDLQLTECGTVDREYDLDNRTGHCYKFHNYATNWTHALKTCALEGGYLAIINSVDEAQVLKELFARFPAGNIRGADNNDIVNIGFKDWYETGTWRTIHGESLYEAGYAMWGQGKPDKLFYKGEYPGCGSINRNALLDDNYCILPSAYICEKDPKSVRT